MLTPSSFFSSFDDGVFTFLGQRSMSQKDPLVARSVEQIQSLNHPGVVALLVYSDDQDLGPWHGSLNAYRHRQAMHSVKKELGDRVEIVEFDRGNFLKFLGEENLDDSPVSRAAWAALVLASGAV